MNLLITGTSKGIGRGLAEHFLAGGARVAGCSRGDATITHEHYEHHALDVADENAVVAMVRKVARMFGRIDGLLNNAGIAVMNPVALTPAASARAVFETNFLGSFLFCREVGKIMQRQGGGRIVNFTTVAEPWRLEGEAAYAASKAAVESLTRILAREFGPAGITVNAVGPTPVATDLVAGVPAEKMEALIQRQALRRWGTVADVANAVEFFLSARSDFVSGQVLYLGGVG